MAVVRDPGTLLLLHPDGQTFEFEPGALCLAFIVTGGRDQPRFETMHRPGDLGRWIQDVLAARVGGLTRPALAHAKQLREAIWDLADATADGEPLPAPAVDELNRWAARPTLVPRVGLDGRGEWARGTTAEQALAEIARDAVALFTGPLAARVRRCEGVRCALIFADASRSGRRRWCSMQRCGNRAKVRAFRERNQREDES
jgi:predicted RNA-binding Zn ribbon-like protein